MQFFLLKQLRTLFIFPFFNIFLKNEMFGCNPQIVVLSTEIKANSLSAECMCDL